MKKIAIIGHFGGTETFCDGQTVKTKNLCALLEQQKGFRVHKVDTYYAKTNKLRLLLDTLKCMALCEHIFLLVSVKGMRIFLPLLYYLNKFTKRHIYHYIIGSEILEMVAQNSKLVTYLNALDANWFEYGSGTQFLQDRGVTNVTTLPNFKLLTPAAEADAYSPENGVYRFCTFSRVMREKGITEAIRAISSINRRLGRRVARLDIYGPVDAEYAEEFHQLLEQHADCAAYKGIADNSKSVDTLRRYYALLFPTFWPGEGFPGTIIDAFASGLPVIASDWNANGEILQHMTHGILYPSGTIQALEDAVMWAVQNPNAMEAMRIACRQEFENYTPKYVLDVILTQMQRHDRTFSGSIT